MERLFTALPLAANVNDGHLLFETTEVATSYELVAGTRNDSNRDKMKALMSFVDAWKNAFIDREVQWIPMRNLSSAALISTCWWAISQ